jgi:hypothetical protein
VLSSLWSRTIVFFLSTGLSKANLVGIRFFLTVNELLLLQLLLLPNGKVVLRKNSMLAILFGGASWTAAPWFDARKMAWRDAGIRPAMPLGSFICGGGVLVLVAVIESMAVTVTFASVYVCDDIR